MAVAAPAGAQCEGGWDLTIGNPGLTAPGGQFAVRAFGPFFGDNLDLVVAGDFGSAGGDSAIKFIALWNGSSWSALPGGNLSPGASSTVRDVLIYNNYQEMYVAGEFFAAGGLGGTKGIARWSRGNWSSVGGGITNGVLINCMAEYDGDLIVGGQFTAIGGVAAANLARWDGMAWSALSTGITGPIPVVIALEVFDEGNGPELIVGGQFTAAGGVPCNGIAKWNGFNFQNIGTLLGSAVFSLQNTQNVVTIDPQVIILAGGSFTSINGAGQNIAGWTGDGWVSVGTTNGAVRAMCTYEDADRSAGVYIGGDFTTVNGQTAPGLARLNQLGWWTNSTLGVGGGSVRALTSWNPDIDWSVYVGGSFTLAGGAPANRIARWGGFLDSYWEGPGTILSQGANWGCGEVPGEQTDAWISGYTKGPTPLFLSEGVACNRLVIDDSDLTIDLQGNTLTLHEPTPGGHAALRISGGISGGAEDQYSNLAIVSNSPGGTLDAETVAVGVASGELALLSINGNMTQLNVGRNLQVGGTGAEASLEINAAAMVVLDADAGLSVGGKSAVLGVLDGSTLVSPQSTYIQSGSSVTVSGNGFDANDNVVSSLLDCSGVFVAGVDPGACSITIQDSGALLIDTTGVAATFGFSVDSVVSVSIKGGSITAINDQIRIGYNGIADFFIAPGSTANAASIVINPLGVVRGGGVLQGSPVSNLGVISPGVGVGSTDTMTVNASLVMSGTSSLGAPAKGTFVVDLIAIQDGPQQVLADSLDVSGGATLGGKLLVRTNQPFAVSKTTMLPLITASTISGSFDGIQLPGLINTVPSVQLLPSAVAGGQDQLVLTLSPISQVLNFEPESVATLESGLPASAVLGNFDSDPTLDLAITVPAPAPTQKGSVVVLFNLEINNGDLLYTSAVQKTVGMVPSAIDAADFDGDGTTDLVVANTGSNSVTYLFNSGGGGAFPASFISAVGLAPMAVKATSAPASLAGSSDQFVIVANSGSNNVTVQLATAGFDPMTIDTLVAGAVPCSVEPIDVDGDGLTDLVVSNNGSDTVGVYKYKTGSFKAPEFFPCGDSPMDVRATDLTPGDGLGLPEIIVTASGSNALSVLINRGGFDFDPPIFFATGDHPTSLTLFNLDGDNDLDIALVSGPDDDRTVEIFRNDAMSGGDEVILTEVENLDPSGNAIVVLSGDVDQNGTDDIVTVNDDTLDEGVAGGPTGSVSVFSNTSLPVPLGDQNGDGIVNGADLGLLLAAWGTSAFFADLNQDGTVNGSDLGLLLAGWTP